VASCIGLVLRRPGGCGHFGFFDIIERTGVRLMATVVAGKYELLEVLNDAGIRSYRARQVTLGHVLMVHFIPSSERGDDFALLDRLAQLPESARKLFFDAGEHNSVPYVVSWPLPDFDSLPEWLDRAIKKSRQQSRTAGAMTQPADSSEFTRLFFKGMKEAGPPLNDGGAHESLKEAPVPPKELGEFTRFFQVPPKVEGPAKVPPEPLPPPPAREVAAPPPLSSAPGEFTQFFQQSAPAGPHPANAAETELFPPAPLFPPADRSPSRALDAPQVAPPASPAPLPKPAAAVANTIQAPAAVIPAVRKPPSAAVSPEPIVADEYANVIARPSAPPLPPPPVAPRKPAPALPPFPQVQRPASSVYLPMWITLAGLFVLAVVLTLVLALTR
jgi:hypothetical protein